MVLGLTNQEIGDNPATAFTTPNGFSPAAATLCLIGSIKMASRQRALGYFVLRG